MKQVFILVLAVITATMFTSCGNSMSGGEVSTGGNFKDIQNEMNEKFGENAYYTKISITYTKQIGNIINVTLTDDPASLKMEEWTKVSGWEQVTDITLEISDGADAKEFMFQFGESISLVKLGELVQSSIEHLKAEKKLENPVLNIAQINYPDNGNIEEARYVIMLIPENGGTNFSYFYSLSGKLIDFSY